MSRRLSIYRYQWIPCAYNHSLGVCYTIRAGFIQVNRLHSLSTFSTSFLVQVKLGFSDFRVLPVPIRKPPHRRICYMCVLRALRSHLRDRKSFFGPSCNIPPAK
ncbi:hypothetical protein M413DRAFT_112304 [Hebeloma cylindrosporum]|uniref:Uncharacterized protein n=1 Tax=Hebeloma cylindrosporum TaxID=76867 RepID=A0A0C3D0H8_HEBCY|nr:hypothetical protein M413DRAFT_112304 [Hebeloma cylindrosporum h7]